MDLQILVNLLEGAYHEEGEERQECIQDFQEFVWDDEFAHDEKLNECLSAIALNIDFYEEDEELRKGDPCYYGEETLKQNLQKGIAELKAFL